MSDFQVDLHQARLVNSLKKIYRTGTIQRAGSPTSNGRGGFINTPLDPEPIWLQRESDARLLTALNVSPDQALIFVLNTVAEPQEGDILTHATLGTFQVKNVNTDPVTAAYQCVCDRG